MINVNNAAVVTTVVQAASLVAIGVNTTGVITMVVKAMGVNATAFAAAKEVNNDSSK